MGPDRFCPNVHPAVHPQVGYHSTYAGAMLCPSDFRDASPLAGVHTMDRMIEMMKPGRACTSDPTTPEANRKPSRGKRTWRWWTSRALIGLLLLVMVVATITLGAGARAKAALRTSHPPLGQMVDVGGYKLHISC